MLIYRIPNKLNRQRLWGDYQSASQANSNDSPVEGIPEYCQLTASFGRTAQHGAASLQLKVTDIDHLGSSIVFLSRRKRFHIDHTSV